jgi:hypothetical protein
LQTSYKNSDFRDPSFSDSPALPVHSPPGELICKRDCAAGEAWVPPNDCTSCLSGCNKCTDVTLECLDITIDFKIEKIGLKTLVGEDKLGDVDGYFNVKFYKKDYLGNLTKWNVKDGEAIDWNSFFQVDGI